MSAKGQPKRSRNRKPRYDKYRSSERGSYNKARTIFNSIKCLRIEPTKKLAMLQHIIDTYDSKRHKVSIVKSELKSYIERLKIA